MTKGRDFARRIKRRLLNGEPAWKLPPQIGQIAGKSGISSMTATAKVTQALSIEAGAPLGEDECGAIWPILPAEAFPDDDSYVINDYPIPHEDLRTSLLFFDRFDVPRQNVAGEFDWCDSIFKRIGVFSPSTAQANGEVSAILRNLPFNTLLARDKSEPGRWTLARPAQALGVPKNELTPHTGIALTLQNALPTFTRSVELEDVLEFKRRSWAELVALRTHLNDIIKEAAHNGTNDFENSVAYRQFAKALGNHIRLMNESNYAKVWRSLKASIDLPSATAPGIEFAYTGTIDYHTLGAGAVAVGIRTVNGLRRKRDPLNPFEYLTSANLAL